MQGSSRGLVGEEFSSPKTCSFVTQSSLFVRMPALAGGTLQGHAATFPEPFKRKWPHRLSLGMLTQEERGLLCRDQSREPRPHVQWLSAGSLPSYPALERGKGGDNSSFFGAKQTSSPSQWLWSQKLELSLNKECRALHRLRQA